MPRPSPGVDRTVAVLNLLAVNPGRSFSLSELCRQLELSKATAHAMLGALTDAGFLLRHPIDKTYSLGPALIALGGAAASRQLELAEFAREPMRELTADLGLQCVLSVSMGEEIVFLAVAGEPVPFGPHVRVGQRLPLAPPLGTVFMAWSQPFEIDRWLRRAAGDDGEAYSRLLREALRAVRLRGYSIGSEPLGVGARLGQSLDDLRSMPGLVDELGASDYLLLDLPPDTKYRLSHLAAPVFGADGNIALVLTLFGFPHRVTVGEIASMARRLLVTTSAVTKSLRGS